MMKRMMAVAVIGTMVSCGHAQAGDRLGAVLGGVAVGTVGGVLLGSALSAHARPAPVYAPAPDVLDEVEAPPRRIVIERSPWDDQATRLHDRCDDGDRHACIRFGILIGQHREHMAAWRRSHPDFFSYED